MVPSQLPEPTHPNSHLAEIQFDRNQKKKKKIYHIVSLDKWKSGKWKFGQVQFGQLEGDYRFNRVTKIL